MKRLLSLGLILFSFSVNATIFTGAVGGTGIYGARTDAYKVTCTGTANGVAAWLSDDSVSYHPLLNVHVQRNGLFSRFQPDTIGGDNLYAPVTAMPGTTTSTFYVYVTKYLYEGTGPRVAEPYHVLIDCVSNVEVAGISALTRLPANTTITQTQNQ